MTFTEEFDGVWASASLLHCPRKQIPNVLKRIHSALKPDGIAYLSYRATPSVTTIEQPVQEELQAIPYFSDLKIACGHFKSSEHSLADVQLKALPFSYGRLDPAKHFLARASGNSMNGGKKPIKDGDYLLLELITPTSAGSNNGRTVAIERQDVSGDDQYLLRTVKKLSQQEYQLLAQNPDYQSIMATEDMNTFARLKQVISAEEINSFSDQ